MFRSLKFDAGDHAHAAHFANHLIASERIAETFAQRNFAHDERALTEILLLENVEEWRGQYARMDMEFSLNVKVWTIERFNES